MSLRFATQLLVPALALTSLYLTTTGRITLTTAKYDLMFTATIAAFVAISIWEAPGGNRGVDFFAGELPVVCRACGVGYTILSVLTKPWVWPLVAIVIAFSAVLGTAYLLHIAVEMPTHRRGQRWARRIGHLASRPWRHGLDLTQPQAWAATSSKTWLRKFPEFVLKFRSPCRCTRDGQRPVERKPSELVMLTAVGVSACALAGCSAANSISDAVVSDQVPVSAPRLSHPNAGTQPQTSLPSPRTDLLR